MTDAKHEAPADHHERNLTASNAELIEQALSHPPLEAPAEGAGDNWPWSKPEYKAADEARTAWLKEDANDQMGALAAAVDAALRARSSAPEAREGAAKP